MKRWIKSIAWNAHLDGKRAAYFEAAAHRHGSAFWFYVVAIAITWWCATWRWALIPEALALWTAWNAISASLVAHYMRQLETNANDPSTDPAQNASAHNTAENASEQPKKSWEQIAREHPGILYAHEQASTILERQHPDWTLQQLRETYPHILFRTVPRHASDWTEWEKLANDLTVPEATRREYRAQLDIRDMLARRRTMKAEVDEQL